jgi:hypothetical protein
MPASALPRRTGGRARWLLPPGPRKALLAVHVIVAVGWFGLDLCLLVLAVTGAVTGDPLLRRAAYLALGQLGGTLIIPVSVAALVTGITLAAGTRWGLVKYRWVLVSLLLTTPMTAAVIFALLPLLQGAAHAAATHTSAAAAVGGERFSVIIASSAEMAVLITIAVINIVKPWGRTRRAPAGR